MGIFNWLGFGSKKKEQPFKDGWLDTKATRKSVDKKAPSPSSYSSSSAKKSDDSSDNNLLYTSLYLNSLSDSTPSYDSSSSDSGSSYDGASDGDGGGASWD